MGQGQSGATASSSVPMAETGAGDRRRRRRRRDDSDSDSDSEYDIERGPEKETPAQVRPPPPHASASAVLGGEKEVTKEMYGEAAPDDELSPAMLMRLQRIREERRRKEMDRDAQRRKEQEYPMIYGDACTGSNEFNSMIYALFKMAFYCAFLGICIAIITYDYQLTPCREFGNECLYSDVSKMCVATSGSDACRIECINSGLPFAEAGCEVLTTPPHTVTCIGNFRAQCITRLTCPARPNKEVRSGLKYAAATLGILAIMELLYGIAMMITKSMHVSDFNRLSMFQKGVVIYVRVWGTASQVMWFVGIVANIYIFYVWNKYTGMCSDAVTTDGSKYRFFNDVLYLAIALLLYHFVTLALGTFFRARLPLRGTLYRPSTDAEILVPLGLDCRSCRSRARPRWFPCFKKHMRKENCTGCCCNCTSCMIDTFCCLTFEWFGLCLEKFWRHRHFIGP